MWYCGGNDPALDMAQGFWALLIPHGLGGGALSHITSVDNDDDDDDEDDDEDMISGSGPETRDESGGWTSEHTQWWFDFLNEKGGKGISKDTWQMVSPSSHSLSLIHCLSSCYASHRVSFVFGSCCHHLHIYTSISTPSFSSFLPHTHHPHSHPHPFFHFPFLSLLFASLSPLS